MNQSNILLEVNNMKKYFYLSKSQTLKAVDDVSFHIYKGETLGLIGESGCGKTTCGRTLMGLYDATDGEIKFDNIDVTTVSRKERKTLKKRLQIILQDPYASLNPRMTVLDIVAEGIDAHKLYVGKARTDRVYELLNLVGLSVEHASRFPHEFSGGQRQRIGIARALAVEPEFIVCDEAISALDVSIQAQIVNLLIDLQNKLNLTYLFIAHDLSMVKYISDRVGIMYLGKIVEIGNTESIYDNPLHPYTKALMSSIPVFSDSPKANRIKLEGEIPSPINTAPGCSFASRCNICKDICNTSTPKLKEITDDYFVACHFV